MLYYLAFTTGLLGSLHCLGMCGPLALALPVGGLSPRRAALARLVYSLGRVGTYAALGLAVGWLGQRVALGGFARGVSLAAAVLLLVAQLPSHWVPVQPLRAASVALRQRVMPLLRRRSLVGMAGLGVVNGLLPCGVLYVALANAAASATPGHGALCMILFGAGTLPAFAAVWLLPQTLNANFRHRIQRLMPVVPFVVAALLLLRGLNLGIPYLSPAAPGPTTSSAKNIPLCHTAPRRR
jgi:sulfite exporter TauE/SafE